MSTPIYNSELYKEIWPINNLIDIMEEQLESVKIQISKGEKQIIINICGITIELDYKENEKTIIV